jgi:RNA polymerase sigma-70 factor, ECF subfamily
MRSRLDIVPHLDDLWRYARVLTRADNDAEELVQESLARALSAAKSYDQSRPILPWLISIVRNTYLTDQSRQNAERRRSAHFTEIVRTSELPAQEHSADLLRVQRAMEQLPTEFSEVLHLVGVLGFAYADAAKVLGIPTGTVMSRLSRARTALKQYLEVPPAETVGLRVVRG